MKLLDIIKESLDISFLKKRKKSAEHVFKLFKKGKISKDTKNGEIIFSYELSDLKLINVISDGDIFISPNYIKIKYENELTNKIGVGPLIDLIQKKFNTFRITLREPNWNNIHTDKWEEPTKLNESYDDKMKHKVKVVYKVLKKGVVTINGTGISVEDTNDVKYRYELNDDYVFLDGRNPPIVVVKEISKNQKLKIYKIQSNGEETYVNIHNFDIFPEYNKVWNKIVFKFQKFGIILR